MLGGDSFTALASGLPNALGGLGGAPTEHRSDSLSAAFHNAAEDSAANLTTRYAALCAHYGMRPTRTRRGVAHENGSIEGPHAHLKANLAQALLLRGSAGFDHLHAYRRFVDDVAGRQNAGRRRAVELERAVLRQLPAMATSFLGADAALAALTEGPQHEAHQPGNDIGSWRNPLERAAPPGYRSLNVLR